MYTFSLLESGWFSLSQVFTGNGLCWVLSTGKKTTGAGSGMFLKADPWGRGWCRFLPGVSWAEWSRGHCLMATGLPPQVSVLR